MRRFGLCCGAFGAFFLSIVSALAQNSLDILEQDLNQVKQEHQESSSRNMADMLAKLSSAVQSPEAAVNLYQTAGGQMPQPTPVVTQNVYETPDEKNARLDLDQLSQVAVDLWATVQL